MSDTFHGLMDYVESSCHVVILNPEAYNIIIFIGNHQRQTYIKENRKQDYQKSLCDRKDVYEYNHTDILKAL